MKAQQIALELINNFRSGILAPRDLRWELYMLFPECENEIKELQDDGTLKTDRFSGVFGPGSNSYEVFFTDDDFEEA